MKRIIAVSMFLALMLAPAQPAFAGEEPIDSGTIVTTYGSSIDGEPDTCEAAPDCRAWLQSGCDPVLAGRDPAVSASIEDVSKIADGRTPWLFQLEACCRAKATIQLWRPDCTEITGSRQRSGGCFDTSIGQHCGLTSIRIPESATWMTVTANDGYLPWLVEFPLTVSWSLRSPPPPRSVDLALRGHLWGVGRVVAEDPSCRAEVPIVVQERNENGWFEMGTTNTNSDGEFEVWLADRAARYRAIALPVSSPVGTCLGSISPIVRHRH